MKSGQINPKDSKVYFDYYARPLKDEPTGQQALTTFETFALGKSLIEGSDCKACDTLDKVSIGPSFTAVSQRYKGDVSAADRLSRKIIDGGGGVWGDYYMSAHPRLTADEALQMATYILSVAEGKKKRTNLPLRGTLNFNEHKGSDHGIYSPNGHGEPTLMGHGKYALIASYTDNGGVGVGPLTDSRILTFRNHKVSVFEADEMHRVNNWKNVCAEFTTVLIFFLRILI
jgi:cytochrome c